jgi:hypothetical protein
VHHQRDAPAGAEPDEHDQPAATRDHRALGDAPGEVPDRVDVEAVDRPPALGRDLFGRRDELTARVVHQHVDPAEPVQDRIDERGHVLGFADVGARHRQDPSACRRELGGDLIERFGPPAGDHHGRTGARVLARDRPAQTRPAAGHERDEALVGIGRERGAVRLGHPRMMPDRIPLLP